jgi:hypothetical protein
LCAQETATVAALKSTQEQASRDAGLADAGRAYQDEIFGAPDEVQGAELPDDPGFNAWLAVERESGQRPFLGHAGVLDPALDTALDLVLVLRAKQDDEQFVIIRFRPYRLLYLVGQDLAELVQLEVAQ